MPKNVVQVPYFYGHFVERFCASGIIQAQIQFEFGFSFGFGIGFDFVFGFAF